MQRYKVICLQCNGSRLVEIHQTQMGRRIDWLEEKQPGPFTIISGRERLDGEFGFQCTCGANDLLTSQEKAGFSNPASPSPKEINEIVSNLKPDRPKFRLAVV